MHVASQVIKIFKTNCFIFNETSQFTRTGIKATQLQKILISFTLLSIMQFKYSI